VELTLRWRETGGPARNRHETRQGSLEIDIGLLEINLNALRSFPVADILRDRGIPFVFLTGYGRGAISDAYAGERLVAKPVSREALRGVISGLWQAAASPK
jgi:hypothetical protein